MSTIHDIAALDILDGKVVRLEVTDKEEVKGADELTGQKARYLFVVTNAEGKEVKVSASTLKAKGVTQSQIDKAYNVHYYRDAASKPRISGEEKAAALDTFLNE